EKGRRKHEDDVQSDDRGHRCSDRDSIRPSQQAEVAGAHAEQKDDEARRPEREPKIKRPSQPLAEAALSSWDERRRLRCGADRKHERGADETAEDTHETKLREMRNAYNAADYHQFSRHRCGAYGGYA